MSKSTWRVGTIGYGGAFNMGKTHLASLAKNAGFIPAAVCDADASRTEVAATDFPGIERYTKVADMLAKAKLDLVIIITPHDSHADLAVQCLNAGAGVVVEKPMAITTAEVVRMVETAKKKKKFLSTFHNRRWDGDYMALKKLLAEGVIGRIFRIDAGFNGFGPQRDWWRSSKKISGGSLYDWGAHFTDWILGIVPSELVSVTGHQHKNPAWSQYDNEDHSEAHYRFKDGTVASLTISNLAMIDKPRWTILGEKGSIVHNNGWGDSDFWIVKIHHGGRTFETKVKFEKSDWDGYYRNVAAHLTKGEALSVTPESAARVIAALHSADVSAHQGGKAIVPKFR
jgi:predicted dehydrogenase